MEGITSESIQKCLFHTNTTIQQEDLNDITTSAFMDLNRRTYFTEFHHNSLPTTASTSSYDCEFYEFVVVGVVNIFIVIFGLIGNTLVKTTLWNERGKSPTSFLLIVLAFADNMVAHYRWLHDVWFEVSKHRDIKSTLSRSYLVKVQQ